MEDSGIAKVETVASHLERTRLLKRRPTLSDPAGSPAPWTLDPPRRSLRTALDPHALAQAGSLPAPTDKGTPTAGLPHSLAAARPSPSFLPPPLALALRLSFLTPIPEAAHLRRRRELALPRGLPNPLHPRLP